MIIEAHASKAHRTKIILAFLAVYLIWGSTFLAIKFVVETVPPFLFAGVRFMLAGVLLYGWARYRGATLPTWVEIRSAAIVGAFLLFASHGMVVWVEQFLASGITALLCSTVPIWMVIFGLFSRKTKKPRWLAYIGVALGFAGMLLIYNPVQEFEAGNTDVLALVLLLLAPVFWAIGSIYGSVAKVSSFSGVNSGLQMLTGGMFLTAFGLVSGELAQLDLSRVSLLSGMSFFYLLIFGSLIGYSSYSWLLRNVSPAQASTNAYINPIVALILGWALAGESLVFMDIIAAGIILFGVFLITISKNQKNQVKKTKEIVLTEGAAAPGGYRDR